MSYSYSRSRSSSTPSRVSRVVSPEAAWATTRARKCTRTRQSFRGQSAGNSPGPSRSRRLTTNPSPKTSRACTIDTSSTRYSTPSIAADAGGAGNEKDEEEPEAFLFEEPEAFLFGSAEPEAFLFGSAFADPRSDDDVSVSVSVVSVSIAAEGEAHTTHRSPTRMASTAAPSAFGSVPSPLTHDTTRLATNASFHGTSKSAESSAGSWRAGATRASTATVTSNGGLGVSHPSPSRTTRRVARGRLVRRHSGAGGFSCFSVFGARRHPGGCVFPSSGSRTAKARRRRRSSTSTTSASSTPTPGGGRRPRRFASGWR